MARKLQKLTAKAVEGNRKPGYYPDGGGLYLQITRQGYKSWIFRYLSSDKKDRWMGLGPVRDVSLAEARDKASICRKHLVSGLDPIKVRENEAQERALNAAKSMTFGQCATAYIKAHRTAWKNTKHANQWENTIEAYCSVINPLPVQEIDTGLILKCLEPIWNTKQETASRLRGRIERVMDWASARGYRSGENPARWRGHLDKLLPSHKKARRVKHHPALPFEEIGPFMQTLRKQEGIGAKALEFAILTAARTGEVIGATPDEFDVQKSVWTIPAARMKAHKEHKVPLTPRALEIIKGMLKLEGEYVFPGQREGKSLSNMAMLSVLKRMERSDLTVHGFRSSFRDWAAECTNYPREVAEMALAHTIGDKTEAAYRRGDLFEKRRKMMQAWADYISEPRKRGGVTNIRQRA